MDTQNRITVMVTVDQCDAYGPYLAEIETAHSKNNIWEEPFFTAETVSRIIADHTRVVGHLDPRREELISWDGTDVLVTTGDLAVGRDDGTPEVMRIRPDASGGYRLFLGWEWTIHRS